MLGLLGSLCFGIVLWISKARPHWDPSDPILLSRRVCHTPCIIRYAAHQGIRVRLSVFHLRAPWQGKGVDCKILTGFQWLPKRYELPSLFGGTTQIPYHGFSDETLMKWKDLSMRLLERFEIIATKILTLMLVRTCDKVPSQRMLACSCMNKIRGTHVLWLGMLTKTGRGVYQRWGSISYLHSGIWFHVVGRWCWFPGESEVWDNQDHRGQWSANPCAIGETDAD